MPHFLRNLFDAGDFMPHGYCYLWNPGLVGLHFTSDLLIGLSYIAISLTLIHLVRRARRDIPFEWVFVSFGAFMIACGGTHLMEVWTLWTPVYWVSGAIKLITAAASVMTAVALPPLVPRSLALIRGAKIAAGHEEELEAANLALENEIAERKRAEQEVRRLNQELEERVAQRTAALSEANRELQASEAKLRAFLESASQGILAVDSAGRIGLVNAKIEEMFGYSREELLGKPLGVLLPERYRQEHEQYQRSYFAAPRARPMGLGLDLAGERKDGGEFPVEISLSHVGDGSGRLALAFITDITDRKRAEEQLRETAKLESLGVLAGGIAHDFNNLLVGIMGNTSLALDDTPNGSGVRPMLEGVMKASENAASLVRQLLAYAGKGRFVIQPVDVSELIHETVGLIQASVQKNVTVDLDLAPSLPVIDADPSQIQQVVMNLVINGAEAIGEATGTVRVRTRARELDADAVRQAGLEAAPGKYVEIEVTDTGAGMDEATIARIFDPFFTTKFTGRGLGLAAVHGIVRGHKGAIEVHSEPGRGSTFMAYFPVSQGRVSRAEPRPVRELCGGETILVIDDEETVRSSARLALKRYGYRVLVAENGRRGVEVFDRMPDEISLVVLDLTMPVMSGEETLRRLRAIRPHVAVILSSGYNEMEAVRRFQGLAGFLQKPYTAARLAEVVRGAFAGRSRASG